MTRSAGSTAGSVARRILGRTPTQEAFGRLMFVLGATLLALASRHDPPWFDVALGFLAFNVARLVVFLVRRKEP